MNMIRRAACVLLCAALLAACDVSSAPAQPTTESAAPAQPANTVAPASEPGYPAPAAAPEGGYPAPTTSP